MPAPSVATQKDADGHEIAPSPWCPEVSLLVLHELPSNNHALPLLSTAAQKDLDEHETLASIRR